MFINKTKCSSSCNAAHSKEYLGYIGAIVAVVFFGSNFVPVKKYETGDGTSLIATYVHMSSLALQTRACSGLQHQTTCDLYVPVDSGFVEVVCNLVSYLLWNRFVISHCVSWSHDRFTYFSPCRSVLPMGDVCGHLVGRPGGQLHPGLSPLLSTYSCGGILVDHW